MKCRAAPGNRGNNEVNSDDEGELTSMRGATDFGGSDDGAEMAIVMLTTECDTTMIRMAK
jgi:hypothetical protein